MLIYVSELCPCAVNDEMSFAYNSFSIKDLIRNVHIIRKLVELESGKLAPRTSRPQDNSSTPRNSSPQPRTSRPIGKDNSSPSYCIILIIDKSSLYDFLIVIFGIIMSLEKL